MRIGARQETGLPPSVDAVTASATQQPLKFHSSSAAGGSRPQRGMRLQAGSAPREGRMWVPQAARRRRACDNASDGLTAEPAEVHSAGRDGPATVPFPSIGRTVEHGGPIESGCQIRPVTVSNIRGNGTVVRGVRRPQAWGNAGTQQYCAQLYCARLLGWRKPPGVSSHS